MPRLVFLGIAAVALSVPGTTLRAALPLQKVHAGAQIVVGLPPGWYLSRFPIATSCVDPAQRFVASTRPATKWIPSMKRTQLQRVHMTSECVRALSAW